VTLGLWTSVILGAGLRLWRIGAAPLNLDESFEALTARRSLPNLIGWLVHDDTSPPLSYLVRSPFLAVSASTTMARLPSVLCSIAALVLFAVWMRNRGVLGVVATALFALNGFLVHYGREARMYALLELVGVTAAVVCEAWLRSPRRAHRAAIAIVGAVALFTHAMGFFLLAGLVALPGRRRDREAWRWRRAVVLPAVVYALAWGWAVQSQLHHDRQPGQRTSFTALIDVIGGLVTSQSAFRLLAAIATIAGGVVLVKRHDVLGRVWIACFAIPFGLAAVAALQMDLLLTRLFAFSAWAPLVAIAALVELATARRVILGVAAGIAACVLVLPVGVNSPTYRGPAAIAVERLQASTVPGDRIAIRPSWLGHLLQWNLGSRTPVSAAPDERPFVAETFSMVVPGARETGRVWLIEPIDYGQPRPRAEACSAKWTDGVSTIQCFRISRSGSP